MNEKPTFLNWKEVPRKNKIRGIIAMTVYLLWVIWVGNAWLLLGLPVIFDIYLSKKVHWNFWKKRGQKNNVIIEWLDALIFAIIAVSLINIFIFQMYKIPSGSMEKTLLIGDHLYVSKLKYGPRIPNTPLSFPFAQHTFPGTFNTKSYLEWIKWPYKRLKGFTTLQRGDIVVFNFPEGDTVVVENQAESYYSMMRTVVEQLKFQDLSAGRQYSDAKYEQTARQYLKETFTLTVRPVDRRDNYVKRCVAVAGDTLEVISGCVYINGARVFDALPNVQFRYRVVTDGTRINPKTLEKFGIYQSDVFNIGANIYSIPLKKDQIEAFKALGNVVTVTKEENTQDAYDSRIFPHNPYYAWNEDYLGPLWIPSKGSTIALNTTNLCKYERIITAYEHHSLRVEGHRIYVDEQEVDSYTFGMDYYFMMGDNRHDSADSRYWGFVPEDHIVGAPSFIWFSLNKEKKFPMNIRLGRLFKSASH